MAEAILLFLWVSSCLFFICREIKQKSDREGHAWWRSDLRETIYRIEREFERKCREIITDSFTHKNIFGDVIIGEYWKRITELKNEYETNLYEKIIARMGKYSVKSIPEDLEIEYERHISEIADSYRRFGDFMTKQIKEARRR
jgi:hypothetical protein